MLLLFVMSVTLLSGWGCCTLLESLWGLLFWIFSGGAVVLGQNSLWSSPFQKSTIENTLLTQIGSASLKLKGSKCVLFPTKVSFLGHNVLKEEILLDSENMTKILSWLVPKSVCDVRGILGLESYYHCFIQNLSDRVQPHVVLTKNDKAFHWTEECQKVFNDIK